MHFDGHELKVVVVGSGGIASHALPVMVLQMMHMRFHTSITVVDGDAYEARNVMRQPQAADSDGRNKAEVMVAFLETLIPADRKHAVSLAAIPAYVDHNGIPGGGEFDCAWVMADNHAARLNTAAAAQEMSRCAFISSANESDHGHAFVYNSDWEEPLLDPFARYPEMLTDREGDPLRHVSCAAPEVLETNPQMPSANFLAAAAGMMLFNNLRSYLAPVPTLHGRRGWLCLPVEVQFNPRNMSTTRIGDLMHPGNTDWMSDYQ